MKYLLTLIALLFIGCGEAPEETTPQTNTIDMVLNKSYTIHTGDKINNASDDAKLKFIEEIESEDKEVTLIAGSAQLTRTH